MSLKVYAGGSEANKKNPKPYAQMNKALNKFAAQSKPKGYTPAARTAGKGSR